MRECERYGAQLRAQPIDLCILGIGDNGHLAFNDPAVANFDDACAVKIVQLDAKCRQQQANQKHFPSFDAVPRYALTLTLPTLCGAEKILCLATEKRKAQVVREMLRGAIAPACPASILRRHSQATLLLDEDSAGLL